MEIRQSQRAMWLIDLFTSAGLMAVKNEIVDWKLIFRVRMFMEGAVSYYDRAARGDTSKQEGYFYLDVSH